MIVSPKLTPLTNYFCISWAKHSRMIVVSTELTPLYILATHSRMILSTELMPLTNHFMGYTFKNDSEGVQS